MADEQVIGAWSRADLFNLFNPQCRHEEEMKTASDFLNDAAELLTERGKTYDQEGGERSMGKCVGAFNALSGASLSEAQGWLFMVCLKHARQFSKSDFHLDSATDAISYEALLAECGVRGGKSRSNT